LADNNIFLPAKIPSNDVRRVEAVKRTGVLDLDNKDLFIVYNELAKQISNMPVSYTGLIDENRQFFLCHIGMPDDLPDSLPRESTFCQFAINSTKPLIVSNCKKDDRFKNHPIVCGPPFVTFYGGFPIISESGYVLGTLCLTDVDPESNLSSHQIDLLVKLTGRLAHQLDIQSEQRELTASKTIDLLRSVQKTFPNFNINDLISFLSVIDGSFIDGKMSQVLLQNNLIESDGSLSVFGRKIQKEIGLDKGVYKKMVIAKDEISSNLDNMIDELGDL
jgi:hypothetical protein